MPDNSVPSTTQRQASVPSTKPVGRSVPATKPPANSGTGGVKAPAIRPDEINMLARNTRRFTGQKLGVKLPDGRVDEIEERFFPIALIGYGGPGIPRILDRAPWTGLQIVEI